MFRYLGIIWDPTAARQLERVHFVQHRMRTALSGWETAVNLSGLTVLVTGVQRGSMEVHRLPENRGIVLGTIFERHSDIQNDAAPRKASFNSDEALRVSRSRGQRLISHYWGNYVAFVIDGTSKKKFVIKDPTGSFPCYFTSNQNVLIFWSNLQDCKSLQLGPFTVNWSYIHAQLASGSNSAEENALKEVSEVFRGECIEIDQAHSEPAIHRQFYWNPLTFSEGPGTIEDPERAATALRATVRATVGALASCHSSILVRLSGGLDSSILLGCLTGSNYPGRVICWTGHRMDGLSDERPWARLAAQKAAGVIHEEYALDPRTLPVPRMLEAAPTPAPIPLLPYLQVGRVEHPLAARHGATATFNGDGGDNMFGSDTTRVAVDEYVCRHGLNFAALRLAAHVAVRRDTTVWRVLYDVARRWLSGTQIREHQASLRLTSKLVNPDVAELVATLKHYPHPYFRGTGGSHWRTVRAMGALLFPPEFYDPFVDVHDTGLPLVAPILSQPVVELCLQIPVYVHFERGLDRGLARRAFRADVPMPILRRQWKDRAPSFSEELLQANLNFVREQLLDGALVREGLLNRDVLEQALASGHTNADYFLSEIWNHLDIEIWLKSWSGATQMRQEAA